VALKFHFSVLSFRPGVLRFRRVALSLHPAQAQHR